MRTGQKGSSLVEILISLAILGILGAGIFGVLGSGLQTLSVTDEAGTARNIAMNQMDYVKSLAYSGENIYEAAPIPAECPGYTAEIFTEEAPGRDGNLQCIHVVISYRGDTVTTMEGYKVK